MMVLADTSVWTGHWRKNDVAFAKLLRTAAVLTHPFVVGELACGNLKERAVILKSLEELPRVATATHVEALRLIERRNLWGRGIGWMDAHFLASALLSNCMFWTLDERLDQAAAISGVKRYRA